MARAKISRLTVLSVLKAGHWFGGVPQAALEELADLSVIENFGVGEAIFVRGDLGGYLYGIISGKVRVTVQSLDGRELSLNTMSAGDIGGEIAALDGGDRTATWSAVESTTVFKLSREHLHQVMRNWPELAQHMIEVLCRRVRETSRQVEEAAFLSLPERLARLLLNMTEDNLEAGDAKIRITQAELATFLNSTRQVVNGYLQNWQKQDLIDTGRGFVIVKDQQRLINAANAAH
ncbi:MAG: Crp/Fnr family transcriptional regulator [Pseudomonadota bacterium]